jgi:DNA-binding CsgD family transcriptional regulator
LGLDTYGAAVPANRLLLARSLRDDPAAVEILDDLAKSDIPSIRASALAARASLAGDLDLHHEALRIRADHGLVLGCIESLEAIAALLADRGVAEVLADAAARGRAVGSDVSDAVALAQRSRGPRGRPSHGWASLTPTEQSVVALAVQGLTNPEIAAQLYVSRGTIKTHLAHVYAKLGVANRTELAAQASLAARSTRSR